MVDLGDSNEELQVRVLDIYRASIDQVLVAGETSGYRVYNTFDTGSINNDADIDPNQTATDMQGFGGEDVDECDTIVCKSDHEDSGQNEPYIQDGLPGEVAAKNRPIIQPTLAALGVSAITNLNTYKAGFGYSVERWYAPHTIADNPVFTLPLTDPMACGPGSRTCGSRPARSRTASCATTTSTTSASRSLTRTPRRPTTVRSTCST